MEVYIQLYYIEGTGGAKHGIPHEIGVLFSNVVLITLFKCCENICGWKSIMEIPVVLFKQRKLLFKQYNQTSPKTPKSQLSILLKDLRDFSLPPT